MRRIWVLALLALAACDGGVVLEVHTAPGTAPDTVQLFIGLGSCGECPGIQPPGAPELLQGDVYYRDDSYRAPAPRIAKVENGVARFRIEASEVGDAIGFAVLVDSNESSAAIVRDLKIADATRYRVDMRAANPNGQSLGPKPLATTGAFIGIWSQRTGSFPCMGFERWSEGKLDERTFIVPGDDLDCDQRGDRDNECAPYAFDGTGTPPFETATCTKLASKASMDNQSCWIGGEACNDVTGAKDACTPGEYCLPSSYCDIGINPLCASTSANQAASLDACLFKSLSSAKLKCTITYQRSPDNTHADRCDNDPTFEFELFPRPAASPIDCVPPRDAGRNLLEERTNGEPRELTDAVELVTRNIQNQTFTAQLKLHYIYTGCKYKMEVSGDKALGAIEPQEKQVFAQFWTTKNGARLRKMLVPIQLTFVEDCAQPSTCTLVPDESLSNCALR